MEYGIITFRSHPCDKHLDMEFYQMMTPILNKTDKYVVAIESPLTPEAHYHIFLSFKGDTSHLKQKFATKPIINWITKTETTMTKIDNPGKKKLKDCFNRDGSNPGLHVEKIPKTEEDRLKTLGYVCKENVVKTKGIDDKQITEAVKYYHTCERKKPGDFKSDWKIVNIKTVIPYMEMVARKYDVQPFHRHVFYYMAKEKIYVDLSNKSKDNVRTTLRIAYEDHDLYQKETWASELNGVNEDGDCVYNLKERIQELKKILQENNIDYK